MAKLINLQVIEAKNVICVWREDINDEEGGFRCGIALETAMACYMIPRHVIIGTLDDGTVKAAGIHDFNSINEYGDLAETTDIKDEWPELFMYHQFCHRIDRDTAKALVRGGIDTGEYDDEASAKAGILADMKKAGVTILNEAMEYLSN